MARSFPIPHASAPWWQRTVPLRWGARPRIAASFGALAFVLFLGLALLAGSAARRESERASTALLEHVAEAMVQRLDDHMAERFREIGRLAASEAVLHAEMTPPQWRRHLDDLQSALPDYSWIGVTSADGTVIAATQGLLEGRSVAQRPWFQLGRERVAVLGVHDAALLASLLPPLPEGEPYRFVDVAAPLLRDGALVGVLGAHLNWQWAARQRRALLAGFDPALRLELTVLSPQGETVLGSPPPPRETELLIARRDSRAQGEYPGMGWTVEVRQPTDVAFATADRLQATMLALAVGGAALFAAAGWWLAGALTRRLRHAARLALHQAPPDTLPPDRDEVALLTASLNTLAGGLQARETELRALNAQLDEEVLRRTSLLNDQNERLRGFTRSVSHDLRGPLGQMSTLLDLMLRRDGERLPAQARRQVQLVAGECARLSRLTHELLELATVEQRPLVHEPVDHAALVDAVLAELRGATPGPWPRVDVGPLPVLDGDPVLLRQVWSNLLSNAVKYTRHAAAPQVEIRAVASGDEWHFSVADNGAGFDPAQAHRLFGAFERLHGEDEFEGTGIGLTIVQRAVQRHGGRVWAEGSPGAGARFHFSLPAGTP